MNKLVNQTNNENSENLRLPVFIFLIRLIKPIKKKSERGMVEKLGGDANNLVFWASSEKISLKLSL